MKIGGFLKNSFIDWEGKTAAVIFTAGCNFRCGYCHNPSLVLPHLFEQNPKISPKEILEFLTERRDWLDGIVITGGEPTIHKDLIDFISSIKALGFLVKLDTNGTNPDILERLFQQKLVDFVAMDIKTSLNVPGYHAITNCNNPQIIDLIEASINHIRKYQIPHQFRTTVIPGHHDDGVIEEIKKHLETDVITLQKYRDSNPVIHNYS